MADVPHHITTLKDMVKMIQTTTEVLQSIPSKPGMVSVATSYYCFLYFQNLLNVSRSFRSFVVRENNGSRQNKYQAESV